MHNACKVVLKEYRTSKYLYIDTSFENNLSAGIVSIDEVNPYITDITTIIAATDILAINIDFRVLHM